MPQEISSVRRAIQIYEALLWLYPRDHRREYGPWMVQLFRDQCLDARSARRRLSELWIPTLADLAFSASHEHLNQTLHCMKNISPNKLSWILFAIAIGTGILSCAFIPGQPGLAVGLAFCSAFTLLLRAIVEWQ